MALSPTQYQSPKQVNETPAEFGNMTMLTMGRPPPMLPSPNSMMWEERRPFELPSRPRSPPESVELPSIRQVCPKFCCLLAQLISSTDHTRNSSESRSSRWRKQVELCKLVFLDRRTSSPRYSYSVHSVTIVTQTKEVVVG
jgi:hypothetical protein